MHAATLTTYEQVRAVVVSYLQAKRVWVPTATYAAGHTARTMDPDAMAVDKVDDKKGKGKGKEDSKGKQGDGKKKGDGKKSEKGEHGKNNPKKDDKEKCAICWRNHSTQDCWYNAKGQGKQNYDAAPGKGRGNVQAVSEENASSAPTSVSPSISHAGNPAGNASSSKSAIRHVYERNADRQKASAIQQRRTPRRHRRECLRVSAWVVSAAGRFK